MNVNCDEAFEEPEPKKISFLSPEPTTTTTEPTPTTTTQTTTVLTPEETPKRQVRFYEETVRSNGQSTTVSGIPKSHSVVLTADLNRWKNDSKTLSNVRNKLQQKQHTADTIFSQSLWAIAMSAVPALANSAAQCLFPLMFLAFFHDAGLFDRMELELFVQSFPSDWSFRKFTILQAVRDAILLGDALRNEKIHAAVDKGNKKGIGHFAKVLAKWKRTGGVTTHLLDIDASGGTSAECAAAIQSSMNKLKAPDEQEEATHLLYGQNTDSGGGGALESLHKEMKKLDLCAPDNEYLIGNCLIYSHQICLKNAIETALGKGALDKINAMQLLHSVYRLQESIDLDEWRHILYKSSIFVLNYDPSIAVVDNGQMSAADCHRNSFYLSNNKILVFHSQFKKEVVDPSGQYKGTILAKMTQPILTRWWTVGSAASYTFDYYLVLYHACQTIVNMYSSDRTPNMIASELFAMMTDQENLIDICLIRTYNKAFLNPHLDWLQSSKDLTGHQAFQAHNVAVRYHIMERELRGIISNGRKVKDYHEAVANWKPKAEGDAAKDKERFDKKLKLFLHAAHDSFVKHWRRWIRSSLLPAALMSEALTAKVIAAVMLGKGMPTFETDASVKNDMAMSGYIKFKSEVHNTEICLNLLYKFLQSELKEIGDTNGEYTPQAILAAELVLQGVDMRSFDYVGNVGELRWHMHSTYLPLPHQTQFVESAVKEAKNVSATDRSEQMRTCLAIIRSPTPLTTKKIQDANKNKVLSIIQSAKDRTEPHQQWIDSQAEDNKYDQRFNTLVHALSKQGHFKNERIDTKKLKVDEQGTKFKKQNKKQKEKQQHVTSAVSGLLPYTKVTKKRNMDDIVTEILHRQWQLNYHGPIPNTMPLRKDLLRRLETIRLIEEDAMAVDAAASHTSFIIQSDAEFRTTDE